MEKKDLLTAEIHIVTVVCFLFVSGCAGVGFIFFQPIYFESVFLQCISLIIVIFTLGIAFWAVNIFLKIYELKNN